MVVIVKKKIIILDQEVNTPQFLPDNVPLTRERRVKAEELDKEIAEKVKTINELFQGLDKKIKNNELLKWKWLGQQIGELLKNLKNLDQRDIDNYVIWPAIGQYFTEDLKRGIDAKRSGTKKDHYRKCWLLATLPGLNWINSWGGWDAFIDRGEQLVLSNKILPALEKKFVTISDELVNKDYQEIAKSITLLIPSGTLKPTDITSLSEKDVEEIVGKAYLKYAKTR